MPQKRSAELYTIGHSTRSIEELIEALRSQGIELLVDVRTSPRSRRFPHFSRDSLAESLPAAGIRYLHMKELGGWRRPAGDSPNTGWRSAGFRGYADYLLTSEGQDAISRLIELAQQHRTAIMCAEALSYRCHRSIISDAVTARGLRVLHIMRPGEVRAHQLTPFARVEDGSVVYPAD